MYRLDAALENTVYGSWIAIKCNCNMEFEKLFQIGDSFFVTKIKTINQLCPLCIALLVIAALLLETMCL